MKRLRNILTVILLALGMMLPATVRAENTVDVKEIVFGHIGDSYEWHITTWGETHVTIPFFFLFCLFFRHFLGILYKLLLMLLTHIVDLYLAE